MDQNLIKLIVCLDLLEKSVRDMAQEVKVQYKTEFMERLSTVRQFIDEIKKEWIK